MKNRDCDQRKCVERTYLNLDWSDNETIKAWMLSLKTPSA